MGAFSIGYWNYCRYYNWDFSMILADQTAYWESRAKKIKDSAVKSSFNGQTVYQVAREEMEMIEINLESCYKLIMEANQLRTVIKPSKVNAKAH